MDPERGGCSVEVDVESHVKMASEKDWLEAGENAALQSTLSIISGKKTFVPNYGCQNNSTLVALVGHILSESSVSIARMSGLYKYPQISYGAMDPIFSDRLQFPSFYRTVPNERPQYKAIILLLKHFGWNWVGIVMSKDISSQRTSIKLQDAILESGICIEFSITVSANDLETFNFKPYEILLESRYCAEKKVLSDMDPSLYDVNNFRFTFNVYSAVYSVAHALHDMYVHKNQRVTESTTQKWSWQPWQTPRSVCSESCLPGYRKVTQEERPKCCYDCIPCPEGEITNETDMKSCWRCPEDHWSNPRRDKCIQRSIDFLSYADRLGLTLAITAVSFSLVTAAVLGIFIKYKDTPIVKANNKKISFTLLMSLILSFLCPFLFIGHSTTISCVLRQVTFGTIFTIAVSSVLSKTIIVILAFHSTKPHQKTTCWFGKHVSTSIVLICSFGEVVICVVWLSCSPPFPNYNTQVEVGKIILQCNEGSITAFYFVIGYVGFLAFLSFVVAFLARKLPDSFNEAQYITFSMLVFCSVWVSFIPAYLSTKGKYVVAVEVFAILASGAGLLVCIFFPKCYVILRRPELNILHEIEEHGVFYHKKLVLIHIVLNLNLGDEGVSDWRRSDDVSGNSHADAPLSFPNRSSLDNVSKWEPWYDALTPP
ncbi:vomeronasal type-2 receptor 26-like [Discoglossus pictus]